MTIKDEIVQALKAHCIPPLRQMRFKGSFPHFYREDSGFVCLVTFQFKSTCAAFCIELGFADAARRNVVSHCRKLEPRNLRVSMTGGLIEDGNALSGRWRVGSETLGDGLFSDSWFSFSAGRHDQQQAGTVAGPDECARHCAKLIEREAEAWWTGRHDFAARLDTGSGD